MPQHAPTTWRGLARGGTTPKEALCCVCPALPDHTAGGGCATFVVRRWSGLAGLTAEGGCDPVFALRSMARRLTGCPQGKGRSCHRRRLFEKLRPYGEPLHLRGYDLMFGDHGGGGIAKEGRPSFHPATGGRGKRRHYTYDCRGAFIGDGGIGGELSGPATSHPSTCARRCSLLFKVILSFMV